MFFPIKVLRQRLNWKHIHHLPSFGVIAIEHTLVLTEIKKRRELPRRLFHDAVVDSRYLFSFSSSATTSRYQRGWCFFAHLRLTLPSIIPVMEPFTQNAIYM